MIRPGLNWTRRALLAAALALPAFPATAMRAWPLPPGEEKDPGDAPPASVDLRPRLRAWDLGPRVQGHRNTCSVFVVTGALEFALARKQGHGTRLSVEFLNWASNRVVRQDEDGGFFSDLWKGFEARGICSEKDMPYLPTFQPGVEPSKEAVERAKAALNQGPRLHWIKEWDPRRGLTEKQLREVRRTIAGGWPVCGGFLWPKRESWEKGILRICPRKDVRDGHSVLLVGYKDDAGQPGGGLFNIFNSSNGGQDGFLTYEYILTYMNDAAWIEGQVEEKSPAVPPVSGILGAFPPR